jgi:GH24 family phage-related lysozyme (muramidase)
MRRISKAGRDLIKRHEGLRLDAYVDPVGVWTIGYGHTGPAARKGNTITKERADNLLTQDVREAVAQWHLDQPRARATRSPRSAPTTCSRRTCARPRPPSRGWSRCH